MTTFFILFGFIVTTSFVCGCFVDKYNNTDPTAQFTIVIPEHFPKDHLLETFSETDNITLDTGVSFLVARGGKLFTNVDLEFDNNTALCAESKTKTIIVKCSSALTSIYVILNMNYSDDFDPEINGSHSFNVSEMTSNDTELFNLNRLNADVFDRDCNRDNIVNMLYRLEGVVPEEDNASFRDNNNMLYATKLLDFDSGNAMFTLNISFSQIQPPAQRKGYGLLTVMVTDIDDMNPTFNSSDYFIDVVEENSSRVNISMTTSPPIAAYDQDRSSNDILTFSLFDPNDAQHLEINATTGHVRLNHIFDREKNETVKIVIKVQQTSLPQRSALATVIIRVIDVNDNPPIFQEAIYKSTNLAEHSPDDTTILFVFAVDSDLDDNAAFNYSLKSYDDVFNINTMMIGQNRLGILTVKNSSKLDREEFKEFTIEVETKEKNPPIPRNDCSNVSCTINVTVILQDINDNSPEFHGINYTYFVTNKTINSLITVFNATDADEGDNAKVVYTINSYISTGKGGCDFVELDNVTGALTLASTTSSKEDCTWQVTACDSPSDLSERRCTSHPVKILFPSEVVVNGSEFNVNFSENQPAGSLVLQLEVQGGKITDGGDKKFELNKDLLKTNASLDRESTNNFTVIITFNDLNNTVITVNITVTDVNDNNPVFVSLNDTYIVRNATTSASLFTIVATDADEFENALLSYELIPSADSENKNCTFVTVRNDSGEVWLKNNITDKVCSFLIQACDNPADSSQRRCTSRLTTIVFPIDVTNGTTLDASVTENLPSGSIVLQLPKYAENITLDFDNFVLSNRLLSTKVPLDRENQSHYHLSIPLGDEDHTTIFVNITVLDVNDNSPEFDDSTNTYPVTDIKTGVTIATINASDADLDNNANLLYELIPFRASGNGDCDFITIENTTGTLKLANATAVKEDCLIMVQACDSPENLSQRRCTSRLIKVTFPNDVNGTTFNVTIAENLLSGSIVLRLPKSGELFHNFDDRFQVQDGLLTTKGLIDRENQSFHHLALTFKDQDNTTIFVYITVVDINDNSPEFVDFNDTYIINNITVEPSVTVRAIDRDEGDNAKIEYKIISQGASRSSNCDVVTIDGVSGEISLTNSTFFPDKCSVLVEVCDNSSDASQRRCTSRLTTIVFPIGVTNGTTLDASVTENLPNGSIVLQLPKYAENIEKDFDSFVLTNRLLMTKVPLDRENQSHYHLSIPLGDKDDTTIFVNITIVDVNDNSPEFGDLINTYPVTDMMPGATIATINASDTDLDNNANLLYELIPFRASSNGSCDFITIENTTGTLKLANATAINEDCLIMVQACDSPENLSQRRCASRQIKVIFPSDVNGTVFNVTIAENLPSGSIVLRLPKDGKYFQLYDDHFLITNGLLVTNALFDRENQSFYQLTIYGDELNRTTFAVNITLTDVNDNAPEFLNSTMYTVNLNKTLAGQVIAEVRAKDIDEGVNAEILYSLEPSSVRNFFSINSTLGEITVTRLPDVDADEMDLIIVASDGGTPSLKSTSVLKVRLLVKSGIVRLTVPASTARLESDKTYINKQLDSILGVTVTIENITRAHSEDRSFLQISGKNSTTKESIPKNILQEMVDVHGKEIDNLFAGYLPQTTSSPLENKDLSIALIVIGSVFLIGLIICIIVIVRRRRHERYQKRDSVTSSSISDVEEGMTVLKNLDQDLQGDEIGVVNPVYSDGDAVSVNSASHSLVSVNTTVETSANADETIENETGSRHESMPDADSGVPSDREGGGGDSDSDSEPDGEESAERDPNYLAAVLMASNAKSPDANVDGPPPEPPVDFVEEQKLSPLTPIDDDESNYTKQLLVNSGDDDDYLDTADKPFLRLMSARPPTPPMKHQPKTKEEEEEEAAMPSEPLPDYGKKVRFNFKVTEHQLTDFAEGQTDDDGLGETGSETNNNEKPNAGLSSTRSNEDKDLSAREIVIVNDTETDAFLSPEEEVTSL